MRIKKFNEEISRDELKDELSSSFTASGNLEKHAQEIKDELLSFVDELLDDEVELLGQLAKLQKGEISQNDVDIVKAMEIGQKLNQELMNIIKKYKNI